MITALTACTTVAAFASASSNFPTYNLSYNAKTQIQLNKANHDQSRIVYVGAAAPAIDTDFIAGHDSFTIVNKSHCKLEADVYGDPLHSPSGLENIYAAGAQSHLLTVNRSDINNDSGQFYLTLSTNGCPLNATIVRNKVA